MQGFHEGRESTMHPMGLAGKLMMQLEESNRKGTSGNRMASTALHSQADKTPFRGLWTTVPL